MRRGGYGKPVEAQSQPSSCRGDNRFGVSADGTVLLEHCCWRVAFVSEGPVRSLVRALTVLPWLESVAFAFHHHRGSHCRWESVVAGKEI